MFSRDCLPQIAKTTNVYSKRANQRRQVRKAADTIVWFKSR